MYPGNKCSFYRCGDNQYAVNVVWHDDPLIQLNIWEMHRNLQPAIGGCVSGGVREHGSSGDCSEQVRAVVGADGDEVGTGLCVVVAAQAD